MSWNSKPFGLTQFVRVMDYNEKDSYKIRKQDKNYFSFQHSQTAETRKQKDNFLASLQVE